jgi:phosphinothricin acetyltransferase
MIIRTAEERDIPALRDIYNYEVLNGTATFDMEERSLEDRTAWFYAHNVGNHPMHVAEIDGRAVGYISLSSYREKDAFQATVELSLYVDPAYRRRGVARALMTDMITWARECPEVHTVVSVITGGNEASEKLHREFGFTNCGTLREVGIKFGKDLEIVNYQLMV